MAEMTGKANQLWVVERGQKQWSAWRSWLKAEFGCNFFPKRMTVLNQWPPSSEEAAAHVARVFNAMREKSGARPVNDTPSPWRGS